MTPPRAVHTTGRGIAARIKSRVRQSVPARHWAWARGRWWLFKEACAVDRSIFLWPWTPFAEDPDWRFLQREAARLERRRFRTAESKCAVFVLSALWPAIAALHVIPQLRRNGRFVRRFAGVGILRQALQIWWLSVRYNRPAPGYYRFQLFRHPRPGRLSFRYVYPHESRPLQGKFNANALTDQLNDKRQFAELAAANGLPVVPVLVSFVDRRLHRWHVAKSALPTNDVVCKAADLCRGAWFERWRYDGRSKWHAGDRYLSEEQLLQRCADRSLDRAILVQEAIFNHADLLPLAGRGLATVRIVTIQPIEGEPEVLRAAFRMPTGDHAMDNFAAGGIGAAVDLATGRLGQAVGKEIGRGTFDVHPDSGAPITGHVLPFWAEASRLALQAQRCFSDVPIVGWDIAITDDGPVLIEANPSWCVELVQQPHARPLSETRFPGAFAAHYRSRFRQVHRPDHLGGRAHAAS